MWACPRVAQLVGRGRRAQERSRHVPYVKVAHGAGVEVGDVGRTALDGRRPPHPARIPIHSFLMLRVCGFPGGRRDSPAVTLCSYFIDRNAGDPQGRPGGPVTFDRREDRVGGSSREDGERVEDDAARVLHGFKFCTGPSRICWQFSDRPVQPKKDCAEMTAIGKIVLGAFSGIVLYVIGQLLSKFLIEPLHELRKAVGEVRLNLSFHAQTIHTPIGRSEESSKAAQEALLKNSCDLIARLHVVPLYAVTRFLSFGALPCGKAVSDAAVQLRGLSTYMFEKDEKANASLEDIQKRVTKIECLLRLESRCRETREETLGSANLSTKRQRIAELARTTAGTSSPPCASRQASHGRRPLRQRERNSSVKNRMRESCTSGSVTIGVAKNGLRKMGVIFGP